MNRSLLSLFFFSCFIVGSLQLGSVRFGIFSSDLEGVTFNVDYNGQQVFPPLTYRELSKYVTLEAKKYNITANSTFGLIYFKSTINVEDNKYYTSVVSGAGSNKTVVSFEDSASKPNLESGMAAIRFLQLGSPLSTTFSAGSVSFPRISFNSATDYSPIKADSYNLTATPGNRTAISRAANVSIGFAFTAVFLPTELLLFTDRDFRVSYVRFSQASPDISSVSVTIGSIVYNNLAFRQETSYSEIPYGLQTVTAKGNTTVSVNATLEPLAKYTVLTYGFSKPPKNNSNIFRVAVVADPPTDPRMATVRFGNLVPDVPVMRLVFNLNESFTLSYGPSNFVPINRAPGVYEIALYNTTSLSRRFARKRAQGNALGDLVLKQNITLQLGVLSSIFAEGTDGNIVINDDNVPTPTPTSSDSGLSGGAIAGIVIACIFGAILIAGIIVYFYRRSQYSSIP